MAEQLLVSNPRRRRRHRNAKRRPKRKGRRKMTAKQLKYFGKKSHRRSRRSSGRRRRSRPAGARPMQGYVVGKKRIRRWKLNPHRRHHRRRRYSNPMSLGGIGGRIMPTVKAGAWGATGALGLDALWGFVSGSSLGQQYLSNAYVGYAAKAVGAVLVGTVGGKILKGRSTELAVGAMTVVTHDFLKSLLQSMAPTIFGPGGSVPLGSYVSGFGSYVSGLGGAAPIVGTATVPQAYLPFSGGSGVADQAGGGQWVDDTVGLDPWGGNQPDRIGY